MNAFLLFASLLLNLVVIFSKSAPVSSDSLLGVSPEDFKYYKTSSEFVSCKDRSKNIRIDQLNDDFCDCPDASDEPGTSACPNGKFYCENAGHIPLVLFSSRVNDGICDCCDGSDEYDGKVKCSNTCWEAGKVARDKLQKKIVTYQKGFGIRNKEIKQAKLAFAKDEAELENLKNEEKILKGLVEDLKERKEKIEKAEEKERLKREKEAKIRMEADKEASGETTDVEKAESGNEKHDHLAYDDSIGNTDQKEDGELAAAMESGAHHHNEEGEILEIDDVLSKEELGRRVASRWTGENTEQKTGEADSLENKKGQGEAPKDVHDEEVDDGYSSYDDERFDQHDSKNSINDDFTEDHKDSSSSYKSDSDYETHSSRQQGGMSWIKKIQRSLGNILEAVNLFQTPVNISDASRVRKEYDEYNSKLSTMQSKVSSLSEKLKHDFGPEKEFYSFYDRCFENKESKYVYKICPFKQATQMEGHSTTRLGHWEKFDESYKVMLFSNGDHCWNGPSRSLKVRLRCGLDNEITDVDEPSRCEYVAFLSTPNVCHEEKLKELQSKLEMMKNQRSPNHDEL